MASWMSIRTTNSKHQPPLGSNKDPGTVSQRGAPLSISTSNSSSADGKSQSPSIGSALPPPGPQRTVSGPAVSPSAPSLAQRDKARKSSAPTTPKSAGFTERKMRFASGSKSPTSTQDPDRLLRRHTIDPSNINRHTECGRHSDEWLFGGWKKLLEKEKKETPRV